MPPVRARLAIAAAAAAAAAGAGCERDTREAARDGSASIEVREYRVDPQTVEARAGVLTLQVRNAGTERHRIALGEARSSVAVTRVLPPGGSAALRARLPRGSYRIFCTLADHDTLGLYGAVKVR